MPPQEVLILAMTKMLSGICTAGFTREPDPVTGLRWVRPVRGFDTLLPGDMTDTGGRLAQCSDVVELNLTGHSSSASTLCLITKCRPSRPSPSP